MAVNDISMLKFRIEFIKPMSIKTNKKQYIKQFLSSKERAQCILLNEDQALFFIAKRIAAKTAVAKLHAMANSSQFLPNFTEMCIVHDVHGKPSFEGVLGYDISIADERDTVAVFVVSIS